jgi:hypothetical protein
VERQSERKKVRCVREVRRKIFELSQCGSQGQADAREVEEGFMTDILIMEEAVWFNWNEIEGDDRFQ